MTSRNRSSYSIMNVREIIDTAFGNIDENTINFKLLRTVLFLLANQVRVLERRVQIEWPYDVVESTSSLKITEVKIHTKKKKQQKMKQKLPKDKKKQGSSSSDKTSTDKTSSVRSTGKSMEKSSTDKTSTDKSSTDKTSTDKSAREKTSTDKSSTDKTSTEKSFIDKTSMDKSYTTDKISTDKTSTDKTSTDKSYKPSTIKSGTGKPSMDKSATDRTSTDKSSTVEYSKDKISREHISTDLTSTDKTTSTDKSSKYKSSTDEKSAGTFSGDKTSLYKENKDSNKTTSTDKSSIYKSSMNKTSADKFSKDNTSSYKEKKGTDKISETTSKTSTEATASKASVKLGQRSDERTLADNQSILDDLVDHAEKELRVIHQRADSHEQPDESPTPMASAGDMTTQFEKLLVVERIPSGSKVDKRRSADSTKISVVTQEEFLRLAEIVEELQERLAPIGSAKFPENIKLMAELRKTASLTDAMAALQLSARLEAAENALKHMVAIVTEVVSNTPGIELSDETKSILEGRARSPKDVKDISDTKYADGSKRKRVTKPVDTLGLPSLDLKPEMHSSKTDQEVTADMPKSDAVVESFDGEEIKIDCITYQDLDAAIKAICGEMIKKLQEIMSKNAATTTQAIKIVTYLENKIDTALKACPRMTDLENQVAAYADQINVMDTGLSSQMTNYQEQLTQMQHELEIGLDTMAEALANIGGDTVAVTELGNNFASLQMDFENMGYRQRELEELETAMSVDLKGLWKQIEILRDMKSDRDEVADALRDKAGIADLNGFVSLEQFDAVRGDLEKRILAAYEKFNNQEIVWQKAIDDLLRELSEKADLVQILSLKDEISNHINTLKNRTKIIADIVGEPKSATVTKKLFRDTSCLCCSNPASMDLEKPQTIPALPKFSDEKKNTDVGGTTNVAELTGDGDYKKCYPGLPIPHERDPRSHHCRRYCGGSHTLLPPNKVPPSTIITPMRKKTAGDDKVYEKGDQCEKIPCLQCNKTLTPEEIESIHNRRP